MFRGKHARLQGDHLIGDWREGLHGATHGSENWLDLVPVVAAAGPQDSKTTFDTNHLLE